MTAVSTMSVKELKALIQKAGLDLAGVTEKSELVALGEKAVGVMEGKEKAAMGEFNEKAGKMSVKELKEVINRVGLDMRGVTEKSELVELAGKGLKILSEKKPSFFEKKFGKELLTKSGLKPTSDVLEGKKYVLIYNSAHWCPPCRQFTPILAEFHSDLASEKNFEVVFLSSDHDQGSFSSYFSTMPWAAVPFDSSYRQPATAEYNTQGGIPELVLCAADGTIIKRGAVQDVYGDPSGDSLFP